MTNTEIFYVNVKFLMSRDDAPHQELIISRSLVAYSASDRHVEGNLVL